MNRTQSEIVVPIEKPAHAPGNFNCRQAGRMLDVHQAVGKLEEKQDIPERNPERSPSRVKSRKLPNYSYVHN